MSMKNPHVIWASAVIVAVITAGAVVTQLAGGDVSTILVIMGAAAVPVLGAYGVAINQQLQTVKEQTNGNFTAAMQALRDQIAAMQEQQQQRVEQQQRQIDALLEILRPKGH